MQSRSRLAFTLAGALTATWASIPCLATASRASDADVGFTASGPAGMEIRGKTGALDIGGGTDAIVLTVPLAQVTTGIALRDRHMRDKYLEVEKYPEASLSIPRSAIDLSHAESTLTGKVTGTFSLHGVRKPVVVEYDVRRSGQALSARGHFHVDMKAFGIAVPSYLGVTVKPDVEVAAAFRVPADAHGP